MTRTKHDGHNDTHAIRYCLEAEGITLRDVQLVVQNALFTNFEHGNGWFHGERMLPPDLPTVTVSHHLAHAYSAFATSPFEDCAVLVIDGAGSSIDHCLDLDGAEDPPVANVPPDQRHLFFEQHSHYMFTGGTLRTVHKAFSPWGYGLRGAAFASTAALHSIGGFYGGAAEYIFRNNLDGGKVMGLAPYGRAETFDFPAFELAEGRTRILYPALRAFDRPARSHSAFMRDFQYYADVAAWTQKETERAILHVVRHAHARAPSTNLAYAGGVALNSVANHRITAETPFRSLYVQPAAGDNGIALGCAYYGWLHVLGRERVPHDGRSCFGRVYRDHEVDRAIRQRRRYVRVQRTSTVASDVARLVSSGKTVGWFQGGSEFGPRALGHRSILADPGRQGIKDGINRRVKRREDFRPFAPAVMEERVEEFFAWTGRSPYMLLVVPAKAERHAQIGETVHVDGSSRLQTVSAADDPLFHEVIRQFGLLTGVPVVLNTSLNGRGSPIVETPEDALRFFLDSELDVLVLHDRILLKRPIVREIAKNSRRFARAVVDEARRWVARARSGVS